MAEQRISHSGLVARSPEGHAAKGMQIKGQEDIWVEIQAHTFRNWVNEQLRPTGLSVRDLSTDLSDGVRLIALVEVLQKRKIRKIAKPLNQHHYLENTQNALNAITSDGIKLVNIGNEDIVNGNQKLILGLIWSLIAHYQIGRSRFPPKKLMLSWLQSVLPECKVKNFTSDWNSGLNLSALIDYCKPGLFPHWRDLDPREGVENCKTAMEIAKEKFKVPMVLEPEYLASPYLDELSGMTYLSYFMRDNGPGYKSTLKWVQNQIPENNIKNFTTDWNSGLALCNLVKSLGGPIPGHNQLLPDPPMWESNLSLGMKGGERLGVEPMLKPKDMADPHVDHLGPMSYIARYQWIPKRKSPGNRLHISASTNNVRVNKPLHFKIDFEETNVDISEIKAYVNSPTGRLDCRLNFTGTGGTGSFIPVDVGMHELVVTCEDETVSGSPIHVRALPDLSKIMLGGLDPCAIGSIVEVLINSNGAGGGNIDVTAYSPTDRSKPCPVSDEDGVYTATFQPDEAGQWKIAVKYDNEHIQASPFTCFVYDPNAVKLHDIEAVVAGRLSSFTCDATRAGLGEVKLDIVHKGKSIHHQMLEGEMQGLYNISFVPPQPGKYKIYIYFNGLEVKGSPATLRVPDRSGSVSKLYYSSTETTKKSSSRFIDSIEREREKMSPAPGSHRSSSRSSDSRREDKHYRQSAVTLNHERKSSDRSRHSEEDRRDSLGRKSDLRARGSDIKISTEYINGMTVTRKDYENASHDVPDSQFRVSVSERRDPVTLQKAQPLQSPNVLRQLESPRRYSPVSPLHLESPRQVSSSQLESPRQYSSTAIDSSRQYTQLESSRQYSNLESSRQYSNLDSPRQYSNLDSPRQYSNLDSPRQHSNLDSPRQYSNHDSPRSPLIDSSRHYSSHFESSQQYSSSQLESPRQYNSTHLELPRQLDSPRSQGSHRPSSPRPTSPRPVSPRPISPRPTSPRLDSSRQYNSSHYETSTRHYNTSQHETSRHFNSSMLDSPRQYSSQQLHSPRQLNSPQLDSPRQQLHSTQLDTPHHYSTSSSHMETTPHQYGTSTTHVENYHDSSHQELPHGFTSVDSSTQIKTTDTPGEDYSIHKKTYERVEKKTTQAVITHTGNDVVDAGLHRNMGMLPPPNEDEGIIVSGDALNYVPINKQTSFLINGPTVNTDDVSIKITDPSDHTLPYRVSEDLSGAVRVQFTPRDTGEHVINVRLRDVKVQGSPFQSFAYCASEMRVGNIPNGVVGKPVQFEIDGSKAGAGDLKILVNGGHVTSYVQDLGDQKFLASFVPHRAITHAIDMTFNGENVPGSPWQCEIMESNGSVGSPGSGSPARITLSGHSIKHVAAGRSAHFDITAPGHEKEDIQVSILGPGKQSLSYRLNEISTGVWRVEFTAQEVGNYVIDSSVAGVKPQGAPFITRVYNASLIQVSELPNGVVGQAAQFKVDASQAGEGQLEISINDGEVPNHVQVLGGGRCLVSFTPDSAKTHSIHIKFNGETVPGCPYMCRVTDTSRVGVSLHHLELIPISQLATFNIHVDSSSNAELAVSVRGPGHTALPVKVTGSPRSGFRAEWTPREVGTHSISVDYNGSPVSGTPFVSKVYDAKKVYVSSVPKGAIGKSLQFTVDASQAGEGNLEITIAAKGRNIPTQVHCQGNARFTVSFVPLESVDHIITISFNKEAVPGSPFIASVYSDPNLIVVSGHSLATAPVGKPATFTLSNVTGSVEDIEVNVEGPGSTTVPATVSEAGDGSFNVEYCPRLAGEHKINVLFSDDHVPGSPFVCKAYDASNIKVQEASKGVVGKPVTFLVNTSQAGFGNLEVTVNQGQVPTSAQPQGNRTYAISFTPKEAKPHIVELRFNQESVPGSPFTCMVMDASQVTVSGDGLEKVPVARRATFFITSLESMTDLDVKIIGPTRRSITANMKPVSDGKYQVDYTPQEIGDHSIEVRYLDLHVPGSPFLMKAYDPTRIRVTDIKSGQVGKAVYFSIDASQAGAGNLEIIVSVNGKHVPNYVQPEVNAKFRVNFKPQVAADHVLSVKFNNEPVPGSPFTCPVTDSSQIIVSDENLKMSPLSDAVKFNVDTRGADLALCSASVLSPTTRSVPVSLQQKGGLLHAEFNPSEVGPHTISVLFDGEPIASSPYTCNIYDVSKVRVTGIGLSKVGQHVTFGVDASEAGEGTLELVVMTRDSTVRAEVTARSRGLYYITFTPQEPVPHMVYITFNENDVPGSPFTCEVRELGARELREIKRSESRLVTARGDGLRESIVGSTASFIVDCKGRDGDVDVRVTGPSDGPIPVRVTSMKNGLHRAEYRTDEVGVYHVEVFYRSQAIGPQYLVEVADPSKVKLFDLVEGFQRSEASFKVDTSNAGRGTLLVTVRAPGGQKVKHSLSDLGWGTYQVFFTPLIPVTHRVDVRYSGVPVKGSPLEIPVKNALAGKAITATGTGLYQSRVSKTTSFVIETLGSPGKDFDVVISGPGGSAVPVKCYQQRDENLLAEFIPQIAGEHKVEVLHNGKAVIGSPYTCHVYDTARVLVEEPKSNSFLLNQRISLTVEHKNAGQAELDVSVTNPHLKPVPVHVRPLADGSAAVLEFTPTIPGPYRMIVTYGDEEVPGSPFNLIVEEEGAAQVSGEGLSTGLVGQAAMFRVDPVGLAGEPTIQVDGPDSVAKSTVTQESDGRWLVTYTPQETGVFDVRVMWNGQELSGSPFHPRVVDPRKVRVIGGWESLWDEHQRVELTVGEEKRINFDVSEAGPGKLTGEIRGPTDIIEPAIEFLPPSRYRMVFTPMEESDYLLCLQWGGFSLPQSPVAAYAPAPGSSLDHTRVTLKGHGLTQARCGDEAEFVIDGSEAGPGYPEVSMSGMKADIRVSVQPVGNNVYRAVYTPQVSGAYLLNVTWSQRQVKGCPLKVTVTSVTDASKVLCTGDGLKGGTVGRDIRSFIDTRRAGPGELTAHCVGPHKTAYCELYDHGDGTFTLNVKPQEPGRHALTIKYGGDHVPGSPYTLRIAGPPDASKVRVHGPGIEPGVLANFQSRFYCDTRGAGAGQLTVRIRGPKGAFRVEMQRQSQKDRSILCKFDPIEPGDYRVEVKWSGQHVPGSPFMVMIFDTQEELNRYLQGSYSPAVNSPSSEYYGSVGYSTTYGQMSWRGSQAQL